MVCPQSRQIALSRSLVYYTQVHFSITMFTIEYWSHTRLAHQRNAHWEDFPYTDAMQQSTDPIHNAAELLSLAPSPYRTVKCVKAAPFAGIVSTHILMHSPLPMMKRKDHRSHLPNSDVMILPLEALWLHMRQS
jgi:hypothetical protein